MIVVDASVAANGTLMNPIATLHASVHLRTRRHDPKKESAKVSRTFRRFHAHGLIAKIPRTRPPRSGEIAGTLLAAPSRALRYLPSIPFLRSSVGGLGPSQMRRIA